MPVYSWTHRRTKHFGTVWVPLAHVRIQASDGRSQAFAVQIDSGAVVSLLRASVADLLGITLTAGRKIDLASVGGSTTVAYVHELTIRFDETAPLQVPFAIAESESVPNLLGRLGIFDRLQVNFDATLN